ncbi:hypothetical protein BJ742DRAFT_367301 [Cladochytrium replicatum]|nr:hypothetical protein BJ742DRAFT_367301 [Cladochytrium replicatum]
MSSLPEMQPAVGNAVRTDIGNELGSGEKLTSRDNIAVITNSISRAAGHIFADSHGRAATATITTSSPSSNRGFSQSTQVPSNTQTGGTTPSSGSEPTDVFRFRSHTPEQIAQVAANFNSQFNPVRLLFPLLFVLVFLVIFQTAPLINSFDGNGTDPYRTRKLSQHVGFHEKYKGYDDSAMGALSGSFPGISRIPFGLSYNITILNVPPTQDSAFDSLESHTEDFSIQPLTSITAIPALVGRSLDTSVISLLMLLNGMDGCDPLHVPFPDMPFGPVLTGANPQDDADIVKQKRWRKAAPPNGADDMVYLFEDIDNEDVLDGCLNCLRSSTTTCFHG